ncbi:uncharacterized protein [Triticum aestivum]|uniref:uncharacterized protein n=1 Tax=Triticum aestivum TaxID=4565 RepID=UPI001D00A447|nr:uncharacterized protein LOC123091738 [Triticum aestivum]
MDALKAVASPSGVVGLIGEHPPTELMLEGGLTCSTPSPAIGSSATSAAWSSTTTPSRSSSSSSASTRLSPASRSTSSHTPAANEKFSCVNNMPERLRLSICVRACSCHFEVAVLCYKLQLKHGMSYQWMVTLCGA